MADEKQTLTTTTASRASKLRTEDPQSTSRTRSGRNEGPKFSRQSPTRPNSVHKSGYRRSRPAGIGRRLEGSEVSPAEFQRLSRRTITSIEERQAGSGLGAITSRTLPSRGFVFGGARRKGQHPFPRPAM